MMLVLLTAAFLCGVPIGVIAGMVIGWRLARPGKHEPDLDYSDGF